MKGGLASVTPYKIGYLTALGETGRSGEDKIAVLSREGSKQIIDYMRDLLFPALPQGCGTVDGRIPGSREDSTVARVLREREIPLQLSWGQGAVPPKMRALVFLTIICGTVGQTDWTSFNGFYYKKFDQPATFEQAEAMCVSEGGHLASIHSGEENSFIYELTKTSQIATNYTDFVWIGLTQASWPASDSWSWTDGTPFDFHTWSVGEPNDYKDAEHCGEFYNAESSGIWNVEQGKWNDYTCSTNMKHFLCKRSTLSVPQGAVKPKMRALVLLTIICGAASHKGWSSWNGFYYKKFDQPATFKQAEALCVNEGGHLASIHSSEENKFIHALTETSQLATQYSDFVWIGLTQANWPESGTWTWTDGTPFDFHIWSWGEPNDYNDAEHCAEFYNAQSSVIMYDPGTWNDYSCNTSMKHFLCKRSTLSMPQVVNLVEILDYC
ncbi:lectin C-type domain protein [Teladorsagia circumcincta]|uniref:Lectin C-type domain protein n=1 Tax=Teladorsagia circumcincta TaxID=45464 RepID=A0A2G9U0L2_TELCI|nr:lectin C-type domain protein [Teladorsagia circumcincta]